MERVTVGDKYTVHVHLKNPSAIFLANLIYYPINLMAPGSVDTADTNPQGCGPFKFKSWKRFDTTEMVRFENFWETDAQGNSLPYLDGVIGKPKKEDRVRLTALRTGEVELIDNMAYADMGDFKKNYSDKFNTWDVSQVGTGYVSFNMKNGPFSPKDNPNAHMLRQEQHTPSTTKVSIRRSSTLRAALRKASITRAAPRIRTTSNPGRNSIRTRRNPF